MSLLDQRDSVIIGRLRVKSASGDRLGDQQKASSLLRHASLRSRHVPPGGLLCVRSMCDPAPRMQPLGSSRIYPLPTWELAVNRQLDRHAERAVRPAQGRVASGAESVLFLDDAEVLACLASDWLNGTLARNWWWRQVLKGFDCGAVIEKWMRSPAAVPAAIELLHAWNEAERFLAQVPEMHADSMLREMLRVHGIPHVDALSSRRLSDASAPDKRVERARSSDGPSQGRKEREPPWMPFLSWRTRSNIHAGKQQLLVQALMLRRAPDAARSAGFQRELSVYFAGLVRDANLHEPTEAAERNDVVAPNGRALQAAAYVDRRESTRLQHSAEIWPDASASVQQDNTHSELHREALKPADLGQNASLATVATADSWNSRDGRDAVGGDFRARSSEVIATETAGLERSVDASQVADSLRIRTAFGGLFFLLNVGLALGLYADFSAPAAIEPVDVNLWDFVAIFGERFTGGELRADALWPLLAELAGRGEEDTPGEQNPWMLPPSQGWIDSVAERMTAFLRDALDTEDAVELLCRQPASISSTATHIDVFFSMEAHPIEVRIACLDRDPGWIPAGGRYVAYHFD